jgi:hypothetical protein
MTPPPTIQAPDPPKKLIKPKAPMGQRLFGDTLTKNSNSNKNLSSQYTQNNLNKSKEPVKSAISKIVPPPQTNTKQMSKINPISYLRRERTFDMSLTQTQNNEKFRPKFSPQFQRKVSSKIEAAKLEIRPMTTQERYRANISNRQAFQSELQSATKQRININSKSHEKMLTIDKKVLKKKTSSVPTVIEKPIVESKKSSDNSAMSNPTMSASSSFKFSKTKQSNIPYESAKEQEITHTYMNEEDNFPNAITKEVATQQQQQFSSNFYYGMQEASVDTDDNEDENDVNQAQIDAINKFAEDIFKMSGTGGTQNQGEL